MRHWWWKFLGVALLLVTAIVSLRTPLRPSIVHVSPTRLAEGKFNTHITGYNTHFNSADKSLNAWLKNDGQTLCAEQVTVVDENELDVIFTVPSGMRAEMTDVMVQSAADGRIQLQGAYWTPNTGSGIQAAPCAGVPEPTASNAYAFPLRSILYESIRNLNFHVPMWFTMMLLMTISVFYSIRYLVKENVVFDEAASAAVQISLVFAMLGILTGATWARATWGAWWTDDPKLNGAAVSTLIYLAYLILRGSIPDQAKRARLASVYNIFAYVLMIMLLMVLPRLTDSLHPGNGGNPAFSQYDLDNDLRMIFYPAVIGWFLLGLWMYDLQRRWKRLNHWMHHDEEL